MAWACDRCGGRKGELDQTRLSEPMWRCKACGHLMAFPGGPAHPVADGDLPLEERYKRLPLFGKGGLYVLLFIFPMAFLFVRGGVAVHQLITGQGVNNCVAGGLVGLVVGVLVIAVWETTVRPWVFARRLLS